MRLDIERLDAFLAGRVPDDLDRRALVGSIVAGAFEERVFFRKLARDPAWRPDLRLEGRERLDAALAGGRGAVLWVAPTIFSTLLVKAALHDAGYRVAHLSVQWHGPGRSRFGRWLVNARDVAVEERFVERVVIPSGRGPRAALDELGRRLRRNEVVTITAVGNANRPIEVPLLGGNLLLGPGAPRLALVHRAPLLAAITARNGAGAFRVTLQPLATADEADGSDDGAIERRARAFAEAYGPREDEDGPFTVTIRPIGPEEEPDGGPPAAGRTDRDALTAAANGRVREFAALLERRVLENPTMWAIHQPQYR